MCMVVAAAGRQRLSMTEKVGSLAVTRAGR
jgi:hypothetical protein